MTDEIENSHVEEQEEESTEEFEPDEEEHQLDNWVIVFESAETMEIELVEARLSDVGIEFYTHNAHRLRNTMGLGTSWAYTSGNPTVIFVRPGEQDRAIAVIEEDRSKLLDDPNLDFSNTE